MAAIVRCFTKPLSPGLLLLALFVAPGLSRASRPARAVEIPACLYAFEKLNSSYDGLARGDGVTIRLPNNTNMAAVFVGARERSTGTKEYIFIEKSSGVVFSVRGGLLRGVDKMNPQKLPTVICQSGGTCAVHSTFMGLQVLNEIGELRNPLLQDAVEHHPRGLLQLLLRTPINAEVHAEKVQNMSKREQQRYGTQTQIRFELLTALDVDAKLTDRPAQVKAHLEKGYPVILDVPVRNGMDNTVQFLKDGTFASVQSPRQQLDDGRAPEYRVGNHSVLAVGFIPYGPFQGKLLVLDSGDGSARLWDYHELKSTHSLKATLLGPSEKVTESVLRTKVVEFWNNHHTGRLVVSGVGLAGLAGTGAYFLGGEDDDEKKQREKEEEKKKAAEKEKR